MKFLKVVLSSALIALLASNVALAEIGVEKDPLAPRVPPDLMEEAKKWKNPFDSTPENIAKGRALFQGKASCFTCHGMDGRGDGMAAGALEPGPRNFHNQGLKGKSDGEFMYVIKNGSGGPGAMPSYAPGIVTEEEAALIILYERSLHNIK